MKDEKGFEDRQTRVLTPTSSAGCLSLSLPICGQGWRPGHKNAHLTVFEEDRNPAQPVQRAQPLLTHPHSDGSKVFWLSWCREVRAFKVAAPAPRHLSLFPTLPYSSYADPHVPAHKFSCVYLEGGGGVSPVSTSAPATVKGRGRKVPGLLA